MIKLLPSDKIYISQSTIPHAGRGVFARVNIKKGTLIERCPIIEIPQYDLANVNESILVSYFYPFGDDLEQLTIALGFGSIYNHTDTPNARYSGNLKERIIDFISIKDIKKDDEITVNYNPHASKNNAPLWFIEK